jgi:hypothetical protein
MCFKLEVEWVEYFLLARYNVEDSQIFSYNLFKLLLRSGLLECCLVAGILTEARSLHTTHHL